MIQFIFSPIVKTSTNDESSLDIPIKKTFKLDFKLDQIVYIIFNNLKNNFWKTKVSGQMFFGGNGVP